MDNVLISGKREPSIPPLSELATAPPLRFRPPQSYVKQAIVLSIIIHCLAITLLYSEQSMSPRLPEAFTVELLPAPLLEKTKPEQKVDTQIVSKTLQKESETAPLNTNLLSDINTVTKKEQIKRGDHPLAGAQGAVAPAPKPVEKAPQPPIKKQAAVATPKKEAVAPPREILRKPLPKKLDLSPAYGTLSKITRGEFKAPVSKKTAVVKGREPEPFSRAPGNAVQFTGRPGVSDLLSDISDGDITLLNAKANRFAVFVRRVAVRVFQQIKVDGWDFLRASDINGIQSYVQIHAILNADGTLASVSIASASGSNQFDSIIQGAVQKTVADPNPPAAARARDGKIHFIFLARSWAQRYNNGRGMGERRWLVLKTGLE